MKPASLTHAEIVGGSRTEVEQILGDVAEDDGARVAIEPTEPD